MSPPPMEPPQHAPLVEVPESLNLRCVCPRFAAYRWSSGGTQRCQLRNAGRLAPVFSCGPDGIRVMGTRAAPEARSILYGEGPYTL